MVRVENLLPGLVERRVPERPEWVASNQRDPRTAAEVYGTFALAFSTLFFVLFAVGLFNAAVLLFIPLVTANAYGWTWVLWQVRIPEEEEAVSRRRALTTGLAVGTCSWLTVGPLMIAVTVGYGLLTGNEFQTIHPLATVLGIGLFSSVVGFVLTLGVPTIASIGLALWTLDYEERSGREKRKANFDFR
ncbi:hypothetical protein [Halorubellus sp. PRR65]|uniref:hypothetical protein n=1 Tax=Halorubellus sp. PRR65 TaxID=3098148 RepID=UPI002B25BE53|nr:hypothetical protein [Halorubellus sp. PRR65]